jgi:hypothetical protein
VCEVRGAQAQEPLSHLQAWARRGSWCIPCKRAYDHDYYKKVGKKKQPKLDEMMQAIEREPRSDAEVAERNRELYKERKKEKRNCAYPGCITNIGYHQQRLCRIHEAEMNAEKKARKFERALGKAS